MSLLKTSMIAAIVSASVLGTLATAAVGQSPNPAVGARQGQFQIMALNIGVLGGMARGNTEYDAEAAQAAANNLMNMSRIDQRFHWVPGTDSEAMEGTRALPEIWEEDSRVFEIWGQYGEAATSLAAVAGDGLEAMRTALGPVGAACGACHDDYRQPQ